MNSAGHERVVLIVNSMIDGRFDESNLLAGAVDPDTKAYGSYTGIESRHHHSYQLHDAHDIIAVVFNRLKLARQDWLNGKKRSAAFHFGVATHFYMDGFICSPTDDSESHSRGDRQFAEAVKNIKTVDLNLIERNTNTSDHVIRLVACLSDDFGRNNVEIVPNALSALCDAAKLVADDYVSEEFSESLRRIAAAAEKAIAKSNRAVREEMRQAVLRYWKYRNVKARNEDRFSASLCVIKITPRPFFFHCFDRWGHYASHIEKREIKSAIKAVEKNHGCSERVDYLKKQIESVVAKHQRETEWYSIPTAESRAKRKINNIDSKYESYLYILKECKKAARRMVDRNGPEWKVIADREAAKDNNLVFGGDTGMKLARMCANDRFMKLVPFAILAVIVVLMSLVALSGLFSIWTVLAVSAIGLYASFYAKCYFNALTDLWNWKFKEIDAKCPNCQTESQAWSNRITGNTTCPFCNHEFIAQQDETKNNI